MKFKSIWKLCLVIALAIFLIPQEVSYGKTEEINNGKPYIKVYDAEGNLVKSYSDEEIKMLMNKAKESNQLLAPEITDGKPFVQIFDRNGHLTDSTVDGAVEKQQQQLAALKTDTYHYSASSFKNHVMIGGGAFFYTPEDVTINAKKRFERMLIILYKQGYSTETGRIDVGGFNGGIHVPLAALRLGTGNHQVEFRNANTDGSAISLNAGILYYNPK